MNTGVIVEGNENYVFSNPTINVEFEELFARYISKDKSANLCQDSIHLCMKPKKIEKSPPVCLFCVVDISGSMSSNCASNVENMESVYISRLSLVKHSIKTIVSSLRKEDMICIITFDDKAELIINPVKLNNGIKHILIRDIEKIRDRGCTNMWDGINMAIDASSSIPYDQYQKSIMVFTDGYSNVNPPEGIYQALKNKLENCNDKFTISTFSFGNGIEPKLLVDIAKLGNGVYGYCPDGTMVGTIFINYMANLLSTITSIIKVSLIQDNEIKETKIIGPLYRGVYRNIIFSEIDKTLLDKTKIKIELPMTNQTMDVPLIMESVDLSKFMDEALKEKEEEEKKQKEANTNETKGSDDDKDSDNDSDDDDELLDEESDSEDTAVVIDDIDTDILIDEKENTEQIKYEEILLNQILRNKFINLLHNIISIEGIEKDQEANQTAQTILNEYYELLNQLKYKNEFIKGLLIDIKNPDPNHGQVEKAIELRYYRSWGKCYLYSFLRFQEFEQCGNFKDQSLQYYAHKVFNVYREMANKIFANLPPPESEPCRSRFGSSNSNTISRAPIRMSNFNNPNGGCFNGDAIVLLENGKSKRVRELKKGDRLRNHAIVQCLIKQNISNKLSKPLMCNINGVLLTPYHPVNIKDQWYFPIDLVQPKPVSIDGWFNLVLNDDIEKKYEVEFENGVKAITLGHFRKENKVLEHPYFGTNLVLKDLQERDPEGYSNGYIYINEFNCRQLQYDQNNQYCINYYKIPSTTNSNNNKMEIGNNTIEKLIC